MKPSFVRSPMFSRAMGCLALAFVLALIVGPQEGTQDDYGYAFRAAIFHPRIFVFLAVGVLVFLGLTYWPKVVPYLHRPGVLPLAIGFVTVIASFTLLHWYDPLGDGKFGTVGTAVSLTPALSGGLTEIYFSWLAWALALVVFVLAAAAIVSGVKVLAWISAVLCVVAAVVGYLAHSTVVNVAKGIDHSFGAGVAAIGFLTIAAAAMSVAQSKTQVADSKAFVGRVLGWRPGLPLAVLGLVIGLIGLASATWFSPGVKNATLVDTSTFFQGKGLAPIAGAYLSFLAWVLLLVCVVLAVAGTYLRSIVVAWVAAAAGLVSTLLTLFTMYLLSSLGGSLGVDASTGPWQNLGTGGWMASGAFLLLGGAGYVAATSNRGPTTAGVAAAGAGRPAARSSDALAGGMFKAPGGAKTLIVLAVAFALFYPPTATLAWQSVLVTQIGIYVLLAVGLNVVVGWAGLLDLGFIAFYAIGSYVTAYLVGSLPVKPPSFLHLSPLLAIPFAIAVCLIAGVALGFPTLRLRGDYLAIVTLGFGEIIRISAVNADGITNSTRGPSPVVPHPAINLGFFKIQFGDAVLQYWYLLLVIVIVVVVLFTRLERSRVGRAWAAIREDEIAAQASGVNTTRVKLLAFAIGASTSGVAGVFFASQVGFFDPTNFVLNNSILVVAYVVFGGMGSLPGAMAGAAVLTWLPEFLKDQVPSADRQMWIGLVILLMMIFRPAGLIPARRRAAELHGLADEPDLESSAVPAGEGMGARA